jgi:type IV secretion system protein TrbI
MPDDKTNSSKPSNDSDSMATAAELRDLRRRPEGVVPKQSQSYVIAGLAVLILLAVLFSNHRAKPASKPSPVIPLPPTEASQLKIEELKQDLTEEQRQAEQARRTSTSTDSAGGASAQTTVTERATNQYASSAVEPPHDAIKDAERALAFKSRFASNLVSASDTKTRTDFSETAFARPESAAPAALPGEGAASRLPLVEETPAPSALPASGNQTTPSKRPAEVNVNSAAGHAYVLFEGTTLDTVLVNRLDGEFSGPVKVMAAGPVYSQDRQHVLIPEGSVLLGEVQKVSGFGQKRLAVIFHRLLMPDGYSVDLDRFHGLDQTGETGLTDNINNHYLQVFGASIALGVIAGATETSTNGGYNQSGSDAYRQGVASSIAQSSANVLDRFINIPPTLTIREGHRIKVYFTEDLLLPAYENHTIPPNI